MFKAVALSLVGASPTTTRTNGGNERCITPSKSPTHIEEFDATVSNLLFHESLKQHLLVILTDGRVYMCSLDLADSFLIQTGIQRCSPFLWTVLTASSPVILSQLLRSSQTLYLLLLCSGTKTVLHVVELSPTTPPTARIARSHELPDKVRMTRICCD